MFRRDLIPVWVGILVLSGMFLTGQDTWSPKPEYPVPVPKTGQTTSYIVGDDGDLQKGEAWPVPRFTDNGDGTVSDNLTGLVWTQNAGCAYAIAWQEALDYCNGLADGTCGLSDGSSAGEWRLANKVELKSLLDLGNYVPALPTGHPFTDVFLVSFYWSSSTTPGTPYAWFVEFNHGWTSGETKTLPYGTAWCVR